MEKLWTIQKRIQVVGVEPVKFSPDSGRIATTGYEKTAKVWDAEYGYVLCKLKGHKYIVGLSAWSPSGDKLATGSVDHTAKVWNVNPEELL